MKKILPIIGLILGILALFQVLSVASIAAYQGVTTEDESDLVMDGVAEDFVMGLIIPDFLLIALSLGAFIIWLITRTKISTTGMVIGVVAFALSFFKISSVFGLMFSMFGGGLTSVTLEGTDLKPNDSNQLTVSEVAAKNYLQGGSGNTLMWTTAVTGNVTNNTDQYVEYASVNMNVTSVNGETCELDPVKVEWIAPGATVPFQSIDRTGAYDCENPHTPQAAVSEYDVDSRSEENRESYPEVAALDAQPTLTDTSDSDRSAQPQISIPEPRSSDVYFELVRSDGIIFDECFIIPANETSSNVESIFEDITGSTLVQTRFCS